MQISSNAVLITGGASGIGLSLAKAFARANNQVLVCGRDDEKLTSAQRAIPGLHTLRCDVTSAEERAKLVQWALEQVPELNVLVNNAGVMRRLDLRDSAPDLDMVAEELETDLHAPMDLSLRLLPHFQRQPVAAIVNVTTGLVNATLARAPVYCAAKVGLHAWTEDLRYQLRGTRVRVFEVQPPFVETELTSRFGLQQRGLLSPEQVADAVLKGIARGDNEIRPGIARALHVAGRVAPGLVFRVLNRQVDRMSNGRTAAR
jgi:uncharacterized oxidoreductase